MKRLTAPWSRSCAVLVSSTISEVTPAAAAGAPPGYVQKVRAGDRAYNVYVHSYLGHGLMAGRAGVLDSTHPSPGRERAESPCVPSGYDWCSQKLR